MRAQRQQLHTPHAPWPNVPATPYHSSPAPHQEHDKDDEREAPRRQRVALVVVVGLVQEVEGGPAPGTAAGGRGACARSRWAAATGIRPQPADAAAADAGCTFLKRAKEGVWPTSQSLPCWLSAPQQGKGAYSSPARPHLSPACPSSPSMRSASMGLNSVPPGPSAAGGGAGGTVKVPSYC